MPLISHIEEFILAEACLQLNLNIFFNQILRVYRDLYAWSICCVRLICLGWAKVAFVRHCKEVWDFQLMLIAVALAHKRFKIAPRQQRREDIFTFFIGLCCRRVNTVCCKKTHSAAGWAKDSRLLHLQQGYLATHVLANTFWLQFLEAFLANVQLFFFYSLTSRKSLQRFFVYVKPCRWDNALKYWWFPGRGSLQQCLLVLYFTHTPFQLTEVLQKSWHLRSPFAGFYSFFLKRMINFSVEG